MVLHYNQPYHPTYKIIIDLISHYPVLETVRVYLLIMLMDLVFLVRWSFCIHLFLCLGPPHCVNISLSFRELLRCHFTHKDPSAYVLLCPLTFHHY